MTIEVQVRADEPRPPIAAVPPVATAPHVGWFGDPLDPDAAGDQRVVTSQRGLLRVALVAAETAARFSREGVDVDPVAWMMAPRRLFDGRSAIEACVGRDECLRAIVLHGLGLGLDAEPDAIDALAGDDDPDAGCGIGSEVGDDGTDVRSGTSHDGDGGSDPTAPSARLWTAYGVANGAAGISRTFRAVVASDRRTAERLLRGPGDVSSDGPDVEEGFDAARPLASGLVSTAMAEMLERVATDPSSPLAAGLSVSIEQRFSA